MEDNPQIYQSILSIVKHNILVVVLGIAGLICLGIGLTTLSNDKEPEVTFESADAEVTSESEKPVKTLLIDVSGAVENPGVYELEEGSRLQDALTVAGGFSFEADRVYVSKTINLAQKVTDGSKLYIPNSAEQNPEKTSTSVLGSTNSLININTALLSDLDSLTGIGAVRAQNIIDGRPYSETSELVSKKIIPQSVYDKIKDQIGTY